jgi:hypothetical protein
MEGLQFRGHLSEALRLTTLQSHGDRSIVLYNMWRFGMVPEETSRVELERVMSMAPGVRLTKIYGWWAGLGDTSAIRTYLSLFALRIASPPTNTGVERARAKFAAGQAYLALAKRDTASALKQLLTTTDTLHECLYDTRLTTVQLLIAQRRYREAGARLERRWPGTSGCGNGVDDVMWTMERARVFDRLGRSQQAAADYAFVVGAWRTADPELQGYVREARTALARLRAGP